MTASTAERNHVHKRSRRTRIGALILWLAAISGVAALDGGGYVDSTEATWHAEETAAGTVTAATVPAPNLEGRCRYFPGLLGIGARVEIYWSAPEGYNLEDAELLTSTSGLGSVLEPLTGFSLNNRTEGDPNGYTTTVPTNLLGGLLGLGSEMEIAIFISDRGWTSEPVSIATNAGLIGGIGGNCRNLT